MDYSWVTNSWEKLQSNINNLYIPMCHLYSTYLFICYNDVILCGRNFPLVLQCVGVRAAPSCVHFVTVSLSPVWAGRPVSGWGTHSQGVCGIGWSYIIKCKINQSGIKQTQIYNQYSQFLSIYWYLLCLYYVESDLDLRGSEWPQWQVQGHF